MYPVQKTIDKKCRSEKQGDPVDAEELSRRLTAHLAEQNTKARKRWDTIFKKTAAAQNFEDKCSSSCISTDTGSTRKATATAIMARLKTPRIIHKLSGSLTRYQRNFESRARRSRKRTDQPLNVDLIRYNKQRDVRFQQCSCPYENHSSIEVHEEDLKMKMNHPLQRIIQIQSMLRRKSSDRTASRHTSNESHETAQNFTKHPSKAHRSNKKRSIWLSLGKEEIKVKERSLSPATKQTSGLTSKSHRTLIDSCSNEVLPANIEVASSSQLPKQGLRNNIMALLRRDSSV